MLLALLGVRSTYTTHFRDADMSCYAWEAKKNRHGEYYWRATLIFPGLLNCYFSFSQENSPINGWWSLHLNGGWKPSENEMDSNCCIKCDGYMNYGHTIYILTHLSSYWIFTKKTKKIREWEWEFFEIYLSTESKSVWIDSDLIG